MSSRLPNSIRNAANPRWKSIGHSSKRTLSCFHNSHEWFPCEVTQFEKYSLLVITYTWLTVQKRLLYQIRRNERRFNAMQIGKWWKMYRWICSCRNSDQRIAARTKWNQSTVLECWVLFIQLKCKFDHFWTWYSIITGTIFKEPFGTIFLDGTLPVTS